MWWPQLLQPRVTHVPGKTEANDLQGLLMAFPAVINRDMATARGLLPVLGCAAVSILSPSSWLLLPSSKT